MTDMRSILSDRIRQIIFHWPVEDQYAISFFVNTNQAFEYGGHNNLPYFAISYNTEAECETTEPCAEERWNYAYWPQDEAVIIDFCDPTPEAEALLDWYRETGVNNIGYEDERHCYDEHMNYIGKGPVGLQELLSVITDIAAELLSSGFIEQKFGRRLPIIIHDLEYTWYMIEATRNVNAHGEAEAFLQAMKEAGFTD